MSECKKKKSSWTFHDEPQLITWIWWLVHEPGISASAKVHRIRDGRPF